MHTKRLGVHPMTPKARMREMLVNLAMLPEAARRSRVVSLQESPTRDVLDAAIELLLGGDSRQRLLAATILSEFGLPRDYAFQNEVVSALDAAVLMETNSDVLAEVIEACGSRLAKNAITSVMHHIGHESAKVRRSVAANLPFMCGDDMDLVCPALITLARDQDERVRDWAVHSLALQVSDRYCSIETSEAVVDALWSSAVDSDPEVRGTALRGLARRRVPRVERAIEIELQGFGSPSRTLLDGIVEFPDRRYLTYLETLSQTCPGDHGIVAAIEAIMERSGD
jgi:HEAT repeat protein